ncbi:MAG: 2Fe-2S iron-sulfur cluster binding domain-containing protein [Gammaproteobacteria bacterium]|nr:2Fe-2S iron-sulfur cluster binding domain-containing protein [Gammaproteobacteria bacterium]MBU1407213.1 2Fe-2S iron-sulfur cluster binding domain-containing protein [Gammaproteobacteria bacterium]MBU1532858.1 2Fe-2S iron-sulfur cluster binding domain-containing protein [Gammaproteobacteria bacterium]
MSHLLPLSRVAKLVAQPRHALQEMIRNGTLATFDGMVELDELLRAFPEVKWDDDAEFRRVTEIKDKAFAKRVLERALPDKEVLAARLTELGNDYAAARALLLHYGSVMTWLDEKIEEIDEDASPETHHALHTVRAFLLRNLAEVPPDAEQAQAAIVQERILKIMSAHVTIQPSGHEFFVEGNDTLLEAALRNGVSLNYGCSNGNCGECKARVLAGEVKKVHAHDYVLKDAEKDAGVILLCAYAPVNDVVIEANVAGARDIPVQNLTARVKSVEVFNPQVAALHLLAPRSQRLRYLGGQRIDVSIDGMRGRYAIASCPCEDRHIEVQIPRRPGDAFAEAVFSRLHANDTVDVEGPYGEFVLDEDSPRPVIFLAFGAGFAPIKSLIQHAMSLELAESMDLHWLADAAGHYQDNLCRAWTDALDNFNYVPHAQSDDLDRVLAAIVTDYPDLHRFDVYAAGTAAQLERARAHFVGQGLPEVRWFAGATDA